MSRRVSGTNPQAYLGVGATTPPQMTIQSRAPTSNDTNFDIATFWLHRTTGDLWFLKGLAGYTAQWILFGGGTGAIDSLTGNDALAATPLLGNVNIRGDGTVVNVTRSPDINSLLISLDGSVATLYPTNAGNAVPVLGILNVLGAHNVTTSAVANTITASGTNTITLGDLAVITAGNPSVTLTSGDLTISGTGVNAAGNINMPATTTDARQGVVNVAGNRFIHSWGTNSTFVGANAGNTTHTATGCTGVGEDALTALTTGNGNSAFGHRALDEVTTGADNMGIGSASLTSLTTGSFNTAVGAVAGEMITTSSQNTAIGYGALDNIVTGAGNIALGYGAATLLTLADSNNICIGSQGTAGDNNRIRIGTNPTHTSCFVAGIDGVNVGSTAKVVTMGTAGTADQLGTATITAGVGISVSTAANTITIATSGAGTTWSVITLDQTAAVNNGYICNKAGTLALALPAASVVGDIIRVTGINNATGWQITQAAGQQIFFGNTQTTLGVGGSLTSSATRDAIEIVCVVANLTWQVLSSVGNITVV